jgi:tight adherence protein B
MKAGFGPAPVLFAITAAMLALLALKDLIIFGEGLPRWVEDSLEPLRLARREGHLATSGERFRFAALGALVAIAAGWYLGGPFAALAFTVAGPILAVHWLGRSRRRYRSAVERALPDVSRAIADGLSAGHSPRGALAAVADSLEGPAASEFTRVRHGLELGHPTDVSVEGLAARFRCERVDAFASALVSQRTSGGDLAALLRRFADGAAERDRAADDARSATAQARFTGYLVAAMPLGAAIFTELLQPGFVGSLTSSTASAILVIVALTLQATGFFAISRLARVGSF